MANRTEIEQDWNQRGYSCLLWVDPPDRRWEDFTHSVDELVMVLEGRVEFEVDGVVHFPGIGEELLIPAGALHSVRNRGGTRSRWLYGYRRG